MTTTDATERGLERLICTALTGHPCDPPHADTVHERQATYGVGWIGGNPNDYNREYCVDLAQLSVFLRETQPNAAFVRYSVSGSPGEDGGGPCPLLGE